MKRKTSGQVDDFSLILGGPLYQLFLRSGLARPPIEFLKRRILMIIIIVWLPLFLFSLINGHSTVVGVPFLHDIEAQVRFLVALPVLIASEIYVHEQLRPALKRFILAKIVAPNEIPLFNRAVASALRLRNSMAIEVGLVVLVYTVGHWLWREQVALSQSSWYATLGDSGFRYTLGGCWYAFVSIPIFQFILLRWYWRLFIWFRLLWQISKLNLRLTPTHPDRAGGLSFLGHSSYAFAPLLFAQGAMLSGLIANRIFHQGQHLMAFKMDALGLVLFMILIILIPLTMFTPHLARVKWQGRHEYSLLANRYVQEFDEKWIRGSAPASEKLIGSSDIQSLADMGNSYQMVREMRPVPFGLNVVIILAITTIAPLLPLALTVVPFEEIVGWLIKVLF